MPKNSEVLTNEKVQKIVGWFESNEIVTATDLVAGDIVGRTEGGVFGKYDKTTYPIIYGVAYDNSYQSVDGTKQRATVIIGGEINRNFVIFTKGEEELSTIALRDKSIYLR